MTDNRIVDSIMQHNIDMRKENSELRQRQADMLRRVERAETALSRIANWSFEHAFVGYEGKDWNTRQEYDQLVLRKLTAIAKEALGGGK